MKLREYVRTGKFDREYIELCNRLPAEEFCNLAITLIIQTEYLLDKMLASQQRRFLENGGIREAMSAARRDYRNRTNPSNQTDRTNQNNKTNQNNWNNQSNQTNWNNKNNPNQIDGSNSNNSNSSNNSSSSNNPNSSGNSNK